MNYINYTITKKKCQLKVWQKVVKKTKGDSLQCVKILDTVPLWI